MTDPLRHDDIVTSAAWSPRGDFVVTDRTTAPRESGPWIFFPASQPLRGCPTSPKAVGGKRLIGDHLHTPVAPAEFLRLRELLLNQLESELRRQWLERFFAADQTGRSDE